jgi:hypothetical protein
VASRRQEPEITVAVDGASWTRVKSLRRAGPDERVFTVSVEDDGTTEVRFGDGSRGQRPPAGSTLTVTYKTGGGASGNVSRLVEDARQEPRFWLIEKDGSGAVGWETFDRPRRHKLFASAATLLGMAVAAASIFGLNRDRSSR